MAEAKKILIVEDDHSLRKLLLAEFTRSGIIAGEADNGEQVVEIALRDRPDIILLDVIMPKMHGIEMLRRLKENPQSKKIPVILPTRITPPKLASLIKNKLCPTI